MHPGGRSRGKPDHGNEPRSPHTQMLRADSCRAATWDDLRHKAGRGGRTTVDDRGETEQSKARRKAQCADLRGRGSSDEVFPATHKSGHRHGMAEFTTSLKSTPSTRAAREGACEREHVGQHVDSDAGKPWSAMASDSWSAMKIASGSWSAMTTAREQRKPLTNQGTTLQKTVCTALAGRD